MYEQKANVKNKLHLDGVRQAYFVFLRFREGLFSFPFECVCMAYAHGSVSYQTKIHILCVYFDLHIFVLIFISWTLEIVKRINVRVCSFRYFDWIFHSLNKMKIRWTSMGLAEWKYVSFQTLLFKVIISEQQDYIKSNAKANGLCCKQTNPSIHMQNDERENFLVSE